jgi:hypothetical protein
MALQVNYAPLEYQYFPSPRLWCALKRFLRHGVRCE